MALVAATAACAAAAGTATLTRPEHLQSLADDLELGVLLAVLLPAVELQPAFNQHRRALAEILVGDFGGAPPQRDVYKGCFFDPLIAALHPFIARQPDIRNRRATGYVAQFRI